MYKRFFPIKKIFRHRFIIIWRVKFLHSLIFSLLFQAHFENALITSYNFVFLLCGLNWKTGINLNRPCFFFTGRIATNLFHRKACSRTKIIFLSNLSFEIGRSLGDILHWDYETEGWHMTDVMFLRYFFYISLIYKDGNIFLEIGSWFFYIFSFYLISLLYFVKFLFR